MKYLKFLRTYVCLLLGFTAFTACTSDEEEALIPEGKGYVKLSLNADTGFQTKAVNESEYANKNNYTVQILKDGKVVEGLEWNYADMPNELIELTNGGYELKAFYGEDKAASKQSMYVEGKTTFNINSDKVEASVTCKPVCGKITVKFDSKMADYFNDYSITFTSKALGDLNISWAKNDTDPIYMKVDNEESISAVYTLVDKQGKSTTINNKSYSLSPMKHLIINVVPTVSSGKIGISIEVDDSTNDIPVDIVVPSDWI